MYLLRMNSACPFLAPDNSIAQLDLFDYTLELKPFQCELNNRDRNRHRGNPDPPVLDAFHGIGRLRMNCKIIPVDFLSSPKPVPARQ